MVFMLCWLLVVCCVCLVYGLVNAIDCVFVVFGCSSWLVVYVLLNVVCCCATVACYLLFVVCFALYHA